MALVIRPATAADREFTLALADRLASFELPAWRASSEVVEGDRRALAAWFDNPSSSGEALLIAELDGAPAGAVYLVTLVDYFHQRPHGHVSVLAVAEQAEGRGVGSALLDAAAAWARRHDFDRLTLSVFVGNQRARKVYERQGFRPELLRYVKPL